MARVGHKRLTIVRPAKTVGPWGMKECSYKQTTFEVFGLRDPALERAANDQGFAARREPLVLHDAEADVETCDTGRDVTAGRELVGIVRDVATLATYGSATVDGAAYPDAEISHEIATLELRTRTAVRGADIWARSPTAPFVRCALRTIAKDAPGLGEDEIRAHFDSSSFELRADGIFLFLKGFPHGTRNLTGQGIVVSYDVLVRDGYLKPDSPVRRVWADIAPAAPGKPWCP